jgi:hypothetical protein
MDRISPTWLRRVPGFLAGFRIFASSACLTPKPMTKFTTEAEYLDGLFLAKPPLATFIESINLHDDYLLSICPGK